MLERRSGSDDVVEAASADRTEPHDSSIGSIMTPLVVNTKASVDRARPSLALLGRTSFRSSRRLSASLDSVPENASPRCNKVRLRPEDNCIGEGEGLQELNHVVSGQHAARHDEDSPALPQSPRPESIDFAGDNNHTVARTPTSCATPTLTITRSGESGKRASNQRSHSPSSEIRDLGHEAFRHSLRRRTDSQLSNDDLSDQSLRDQLFEAISGSRTADHPRNFVPIRQLHRIITQKAVAAELSRKRRSTVKRLQIWKRSAADVSTEARMICGNDLLPPSDDEIPNAKSNDPEKSYRKIFALLLMMDRASSIGSFVASGVCDADLPLVKVPRKGIARDTVDLRRDREKTVPLACFKEWGRSQKLRFEREQWAVLAPYFGRGGHTRAVHYIFGPEIILPFTLWQKQDSPGGFGVVYKAKIHDEHHSFGGTSDSPTTGQLFAVKALYSRKEADFQREVGILKRLSSDHHAHRHLITLFATYEQGGKYYLIFPWAQADLLAYWTEVNPDPVRDKETALWVVEQCHGLADGLSKIHRFQTLSGHTLLHPNSLPRKDLSKVPSAPPGGLTGRAGPLPASLSRVKSAPEAKSNIHSLFGHHGDIKPNNILWFRDPDKPDSKGTLKITDFGLSQFNTQNSLRDRGRVANSPTYRPPECDFEDREISTSFDMWTLGCVYLEFITWYVGGSTYLLDFAEKRVAIDENFERFRTDTFFSIVNNNDPVTRKAIVKPPVTKFIEELSRSSYCIAYFETFLDMIKSKLLIVEDSKSGQRRICSAHVSRDLYTLMEKVQGQRHPGVTK